MAEIDPTTELDAGFSSAGAKAIPWAVARGELEAAEVFWLSTVRPDHRPHVTPLLAVWQDERLHFCTGPTERKAANLAENQHCTLTTGSNRFAEGLDLVVEGDAVRVISPDRLTELAAAWEAKYGSDWRFEVRGDCFVGRGGDALVFEVTPRKAFAFSRGVNSQTRYRFPR